MKFKLHNRTTSAELIRELEAVQAMEDEYRLLLDESSDPLLASLYFQTDCSTPSAKRCATRRDWPCCLSTLTISTR
jgi:hypothetical protein